MTIGSKGNVIRPPRDLTRDGYVDSLWKKITTYLMTVRKYSFDAVGGWMERYKHAKKEVSKLVGSMMKVSEFIALVEEKGSLPPGVEGIGASFEHLGGFAKRVNETWDKMTSIDSETPHATTAEVIVKGAAFVVNIYNSQSTLQTLLNIAALLTDLGVCKIVSSTIVSKFGMHACSDETDEEM